jgi:hypothetical protein
VLDLEVIEPVRDPCCEATEMFFVLLLVDGPLPGYSQGFHLEKGQMFGKSRFHFLS